MKKSTKSSTREVTFVDTSGFYALLVQRDPMHNRASHLIATAAEAAGRFVTSDYVLDETITLLKARNQGHLIERFLKAVFSSAACRIEWMDPSRFDETGRFLAKHDDQNWSFTDCFSFWLMRSLNLREALTTDRHFRAAGFVPMLL